VLYSGQLLWGFNVPIKGLIIHASLRTVNPRLRFVASSASNSC